MSNISRIILISLSALFLQSYFSLADTVIMKNRERIKGVVVEDYADRVVISTADGERELRRDNISRIIYDLEEQNLTSLADFYQDRGMYDTAYYYYDQALRVNPYHKQAREGRNYTGSVLQKFGSTRKKEHVQRMNEEMLWRQGILETPGPSREERLKQSIGITLKEDKGSFEIIDVTRGSPAHTAGIMPGDTILSVWGRNISYMLFNEAIDRIIGPEVMEVRLSIRRLVTLDLEGARGGFSSIVGARTEYSEMEGLMVSAVAPEGPAYQAGMEEGDIILSVEGKATRYMAMTELEGIVRDRRGGPLSFGIKRDITVWKDPTDGR